MKNLYFFLFLILPLMADAQYAKYQLVEWFTNTYCPICTNRNPPLRTVYNQYSSQLHRITIHPSVPYPQCPLYNFNKEDNGARQTYYNIGATPSIILNGIRSSSSNQVFENDIKAHLDETSPLALEVAEDVGNSPMIQITIKAAGAVPQGDYKLFVALLEQSIGLQAQNGETEHLDVLREFVSDPEGDDFAMPESGQSTTVTYNYMLRNGVMPDQAYIIAFVQDITSRAILNSGTRFDELSTSLTDIALESQLRAFPNPATDRVNISVGNGFRIHRLELFNHLGQRIKSLNLDLPESNATISTNDLPFGNYMVHVHLGEKKAIVRFVKE